jgi:hypothetical protein
LFGSFNDFIEQSDRRLLNRGKVIVGLSCHRHGDLEQF